MTVIALGLGGCTDEPSGPPPVDAFPTGTYATCARGLHSRTGNVFVNAAGFEAGAVLTLARRGADVASTYVDPDGVTQAVAYTVASGASATLARAGQTLPGFTSLCVVAPEDQRAYPATLIASAGTLTHAGGTAFVALTGGLRSEAGACGTLTEEGASFWLVCQGGAQRAEAAASVDAQVPPGAYACTSQVETHARVGGIDRFVSGGGTGTLTVTVDGAAVTAAYEGDAAIAGTLRLAGETATTATAAGGQTLAAPCMTAAAPGAPEPLPISAASLALVGSTLFVSFAGSTGAGSSCPGAAVAGSLLCARD